MAAIGTRQMSRLLTVAVAGTILTGCVERRFVIETNPPGAQVSINNVPIGPSPSDATWDYVGKYEFRAVAQGYEPLKQVVQVRPRWYEYAPLDFVFEALWPFHIEDVRRYRFELTPMSPVQSDLLIDSANNLRTRGQNLPPPQEPNPNGAPPGPVAPQGSPLPPIGTRMSSPGTVSPGATALPLPASTMPTGGAVIPSPGPGR